jgi:hypothetical protein
MLTRVDDAKISKWRRTTAPAWIPTSRQQMGDDTAGILSVFRHPKSWKHVEFFHEGGGMYRMRVTYRHGGYPQETLLPDYDAKSEIGRLINQHSRIELAATKAERARLIREWRDPRTKKPYRIRVTDYGTDPNARRDQ